jgi:hypothetical protein
MAQNRTPAAWRGNGGWLAKVAVEERPLSNKPNRARQDVVLTAPPSRLEQQRRHANQAAVRRAKFARALTAAAFDDHRGTRLSVSLLQHPAVPPTRGRGNEH